MQSIVLIVRRNALDLNIVLPQTIYRIVKWAMGICNYNKPRSECERDTWQFFQTVQDKPVSLNLDRLMVPGEFLFNFLFSLLFQPHSKSNICKNGGTCVKEHCLSDDFRCICRGNFFGKFCNEVNGRFVISATLIIFPFHLL